MYFKLSARKTSKTRLLNFLRPIALTMVLAGAVGSLGLMLKAAQHTPIFLLVLFIGWVVSPFIALLVANAISKKWSATTRITLYILMLLIPPVSLLGYERIFTPPDTRPAAIFLMVPLISWVLIVIVIPVSALASRKRSRYR